MNIEDKRVAKTVLEKGGVKIFQKEIKNVVIHRFNMESPDGEMFPHRIIYRVEMNDGTIYEAVEETVDKDNNFSTASGRYITREVKEVG